VLADRQDVARLVVETSRGSWGIWPHRRDCVAVLVPGVLTFETDAKGIVYVAVDAGVLIKTGAEVLISVRRAVCGSVLARLRETVEREYAVQDRTEREVRHVSERLENGFLRKMVELHHD
jgi:F-type H+-transporting ATPase subunit epsilon